MLYFVDFLSVRSIYLNQTPLSLLQKFQKSTLMTNSSVTGPLYIQQYPDFNKFNYFRLFECVLWDSKEAMAVYESDL